MALVFDTETTGLPFCKKYSLFPDYTQLKYYLTSRVVQVSYIITNDLFEKMEESSVIIKADNFKIKNSQFHGITDIISETQGIPFVQFAQQLSNSLDFVHTLIAHNINFDINVLLSELYRYNLTDVIQKILSKKQICSMKFTKNDVKAKFKNSTGSDAYKDPSLKELYFHATGEEIQNQHNSTYDTLNLYHSLKLLYGNPLTHAP